MTFCHITDSFLLLFWLGFLFGIGFTFLIAGAYRLWHLHSSDSENPPPVGHRHQAKEHQPC